MHWVRSSLRPFVPSVVGADRGRRGDPFRGHHRLQAGDVSAEIVFAGFGITVGPHHREENHAGVNDYAECPLPEAGYDDIASRWDFRSVSPSG